MKNVKTDPSRRHRRRMERIEERRTGRKDKRAEHASKIDDRKTRRREFRAAIASRRAFYATIVAIVLSIGVAVPAQMQWFLHQLTGGKWLFPQSLVAVVATLLIEGLCWLGAFLYADSVATAPVRLYRTTTVVFAVIAAAINFAHGSDTDWKVAIVYALASLMGVGAWELYMHRTRHAASGMTAEEIKLWALRWRKHPKVMREAGRVRATFGTRVPMEVAWRMAYVRKIGNPTVPIAITDPLIARLIGPTAGPKEDLEDDAPVPPETAEVGTSSGTGVGTDVIELPVDWDAMNSVDAVIGRYWPAVKAELDGPESSAPGSAKPASEKPRQFRAAKPAATTPSGDAEQAVTSAVPSKTRNSRWGRTRNQLPPTKAELTGPGDAKERMRKYLARAEAKGIPDAELDRNYIAEQFNVSGRYVRDVIKAHRSGTPADSDPT